MEKRAKKVLRNGGILLAIGLAYAAFCHFTKLAIPCVFHLVTGIKCPSCGVTRLALALLRLDFAEAWRQNCMLILVSPLLAVLGTAMVVRYIKTGSWEPRPWMKVLIWFLIAVLLVFAVVRNIYGL